MEAALGQPITYPACTAIGLIVWQQECLGYKASELFAARSQLVGACSQRTLLRFDASRQSSVNGEWRCVYDTLLPADLEFQIARIMKRVR